MTTLVLTRHGLTPRSVPEQHLGQGIDIALSADGRRQAERLAARLSGVPFGRIVTSPLRRAAETATIVSAGRRVEPDPRLVEMDYGEWEGLTYPEIEARDGPYRARWVGDPASLRCPDGESGDEVAERARSFLEELLGRQGADDTPTLAVAHATLNRVLLCVALGVPVRDFRRRFVQGKANLTVLRWEDGAAPDAAMVVLLNDLGHVQEPGEAPWE